ncbi:MAG: transcriptional repressor [Nitrospinae bacterium RIFCSPLOWO2_12_39_16]|nr:MAG: transcriptional repressor [Nitrospinae bacterium RIFCSPLOWO2_12_39_16]HLA48810.1 transcriptional repressor [Nitrospinota bacterium]
MKNEKEVFEEYISKKNLKFTSQRKIILDTFLKEEWHISTEELYKKISQKNPTIGIATVYRTLKLLMGCGLAQERQFGDGQTRYEHSHEHIHHDHIICRGCGKIVEFKNDDIEKLQNEIAKKNRFKVYAHKLELYGLCYDCIK